jgi:hypothetical protein
MPENLNEAVGKLVRKTDELLWRCYGAATSGVVVGAEGSRLVFPKYADGVVRVSEQEAKQLLIEQLAGSPFVYSVETPTSGNYSFTGKGERSAATDLTLYAPAGERFLNFEFKAHGFSTRRQKVGQITKDLKKLVLEPVNGFWFHTLKGAGPKTIPSLWALLRKELRGIVGQLAGQFEAKPLTVHFCVLREQVSVQTTILLGQGEVGPGWLDDVNPPVLSLQDGSLTDVTSAAGWSVHRMGPGREVGPVEGQ